MQVVYTAWCDDDGRMIEEGTVFRLGPDDFILNAALAPAPLAALKPPMASMSRSRRCATSFCGLALQGPTSRDILKALGVAGIENLPHFGILETRLDGRWMRIDRAGYTGDLGYELWVEPAGCALALGEPVPAWARRTRSRPSVRVRST